MMIRRALVSILVIIGFSACMGENLTNAELIKKTESIIEQADNLIKKKDWSSADKIIRSGLSTMGMRYYSEDEHDDTREGLMLATYMEEERGNLQSAVNIRHKMLIERLRQFKLNIGWTEDKAGKQRTPHP
ncbi:MAG: hypothetical protein P8Y47_13800 [Alphaproteobacteria bacterium]